MRRVYLLILLLAATATSMSLAGWAPHPAGGAALAPAPTPQSAAPQQDCPDDVSIGWLAVYDRGNGYEFQVPPDYADGDDIAIFYDVVNSSCRAVTVTVTLTGSVSEETIHIKDSAGEPCTTSCTVPANSTISGNDQWDLGQHPNTTGEKVVATITVTAPDGFVDANPDDNTATSKESINIVNEEPDPTPDISVDSVTPSVTTAVIGEPINFTVAISNEGDADTTAATTVTLDLGEDTDELDSDTVSNLAADNETTVTLSWDTTGATAGDHSVRALAETDGDGNADNDSATVTVTLESPAPDVAVKSVTASATEAVVGDTVDFTITLENDGNVPAVTPAVSLFDADGADDAAPLASATANTIAVADETTVTISWDTDDVAAGEYRLRVDATIAGDVDSANDSGTATLTLLDPVDVAVSFTSPIAATAVRGNSVSVPFTVTNAGNHDTGEVTVSLYVTKSGEERGEATATTTVPALAVGKSASDTLTWDTAAAIVEDYDLKLVADTAGDTVAANDSVVAYVELRNWMKLKNVAPQSSVAVVGNAVTFTAQVENVGTGEVAGVTVGLYESGESTALGSTTIASIAAGSTASASIRWDTARREMGQVELFVSAVADGQAPDRDDYQSVNVTINNPITLLLAAPASRDNIAGTRVSFNVLVGNESVAAASGVTVGLYVGDAKTPNVSADLAAIPPGRRGAAVLEWDTADVSPGRHRLKIVASMADYDSDGDDESLLVIALRAPVVDVGLTGATVNRNVAAIGQTLKVVATVTNRGEAPAAIPVNLYLDGSTEPSTPPAKSPRIQPGSSAEVTLRWNSTDESVGTHTLRVAAELTGDITADDNDQELGVELFNSAYDGIRAPGRCVEDIGIKVTDIRDLSGQKRTASEYRVGENLRAAYEVYNFSCDTDITLILKMTGPGGHGIKDAAARCFSKCVVPFGGKAEGEIAWMIPTLPAVSDGTVNAEIVAWRPGNFENVNRDNDTAASTDKISIVHPADVVLYLGSRDSGKGKFRRTMAPPVFGEVDVRLASARPAGVVLPFADDTIAVTVAMANDGDAPEPVAVSVRWNQRTLCLSENCSHNVVIPAGQAKREILQVPVSKLPHSENHTIAVTLSSAMDPLPSRNNTAFIGIRRQAPLVDVTMTSATVTPNVPFIGDKATVSVAIQNQSDIALPLELKLYLDDGAEPIETEEIGELAAGDELTHEISWNISPSAKLLGQRKLTLVASAGRYGNVARVEKDVTVQIDAEVVGIRATPEGTAMQGEEVAIEVEVQNNGPATVNVPVTLRFPSATKNPETRSPTVRSGETGSANFVWRTRDYAIGDHTLTATVPDQHNASNGDKSAELAFQITPLVISATILGIEVAPEAPRVGEPVTITVTVRNDGPVAMRIPVTLRFPLGGKLPETRRPWVKPGESAVATFTWLTGRYEPETHAFRAEIAGDTPSSQGFEVKLLPPLVDVAIVGMGASPADTAMVGEAVEVWIEVRNDGPAAMNVPVRLTFPYVDKRPETKSSRVGPGETAKVTFEWKTSDYDAGIHTLGAAVLLDNNVTGGQTTEELRFTLTPLVVSATILGIEVIPEAPRVGEPVTITVTVRNDGPVAMRIPVTLRFPSDGRQPETRSPWVKPGESAVATFTWLTGRHEPDTHAFRAEIAGDTPSSQGFEVKLLPPLVDVAIVGMGASPADTAMVGEAVEVWIEVRNDGPSAMNVPVRLTFPSADKRPEIKSARVGPGETARVSFQWKTSNYDAGIHTLGAAVLLDNNVTGGQTTEELRFTLTPLVISATILGIEVIPEAPRVGEPVTITVTVRNDGPVAANIPVTLRFPSDGRQPETRRPRVAPGATGTASFTWNTGRYPPGSHPFVVEAASDPPAQSPFTVELLPPLANAAIVGMGTDPADTAMVGELVEVWIEVRNDGPVAMNVPVRLTFPSVDKRPEIKSARVGPGETARVSFQWKTSNYADGVHVLRAAVLLDNNVTVGQTTAELRFTLTPPVVSATILGIEVSPEAPRVGEPVTITVTVRNDGPVAMRIPVTLRFPSEDKQPETRRPRVEPGATGTASFAWNTGRYPPGSHPFVVEAASDPPAQSPFTIELLPPLVDVAIVGMGSSPADTAMVGELVEVWVKVRNDGPAAMNVPVRLTFPSADKRPETRSPRVGPGETAKATFQWKTSDYDTGIHTLGAAVLLDNNVTVGQTTKELRFTLTPLVVSATILGIEVAPEAPRVGEPVTITVTVRNDGPVATRIPVTLRFPSEDKQPETRRPWVKPGESAVATFTWLTGRYEPGGHGFVVEVASTPPSKREFIVELLPPIVDVAIVGIGSDPAGTAVRGQAVTIWVDVINNGPSALSVPVQLSFPSREKQPERKSPRIEPGEIARVEFTWKTANYDRGVHSLTAALLAEHNITVSDTSATIDIRLISPQLIASIVDVSWSPDSPVVGDPVAITITVRNDGLAATNIPITLHFPSNVKHPETRRPRVAPRSAGSASFEWRTTRYEPGGHVFRAQIPGRAGAIREFEIELRPPEVDFAVVEIYPPDPLRPIVKGDWVQITAVVRNLGPYAGRGIVTLLNEADADTMYEKSASLEPGPIQGRGIHLEDAAVSGRQLRFAGSG